MKYYIQSLIKSQGEHAAEKIAEDMKAFSFWYKWTTKYFSSVEAAWEKFQDEILNK